MIRHVAELWFGLALVFLAGCLVGSLIERIIAQTRAARLQRRFVRGLVRLGRGILWRLFPWRGQAPEVPVSVAIPAPAYGTAVNQLGGLMPHDLPSGSPSDDEDEAEPPVGPPRRPSAATERRRAEALARADASGGHRPMALAAPRGGKADALIAIEGVSRKEARWLGEIGIHHYGQIAAWTPVELTWVAAYLGRSEPVEDLAWVASATALATGAPPPKRRPRPRPAGEPGETAEPLDAEDGARADAPADDRPADAAPDDGPAEAQAIETSAATVPPQATDGSAAVGPPADQQASVLPPTATAEPAEAAALADADDAGLEPAPSAEALPDAAPEAAEDPRPATATEAITAHAEPQHSDAPRLAAGGSARPEAPAGDTEPRVGGDTPSGAGDASREADAALFETAPPEGGIGDDPPESRSEAPAVPPASEPPHERPDEADAAPVPADAAVDLPAEEAPATDGRAAVDATEKPEGKGAPAPSGDGATVEPGEEIRDRRDEATP